MLDIDLPLPPPDEAVRKLLSKVGGTLQQALDSRELKWSSKELDADDAKVVAYVVAASTVLQKLVLGANTIGDAGAAAIAEALKVNAVLHTLVLGSLLGGNSIGDAGALAIADALKVNAVLEELYLSGNFIGDAGAVALAEGLKVNVVLKTLWLTDNSIGDEGAAAIAEALRVHRSAKLMRLSLFRNIIRSKGSGATAVSLSSGLASRPDNFSRFSPCTARRGTNHLEVGAWRAPNHRSSIVKRPQRRSTPKLFAGGVDAPPLAMQEQQKGEQQKGEQLLQRPTPRRAGMPSAPLGPDSTLALQQQLKSEAEAEANAKVHSPQQHKQQRRQRRAEGEGEKGTPGGLRLYGDMRRPPREALNTSARLVMDLSQVMRTLSPLPPHC